MMRGNDKGAMSVQERAGAAGSWIERLRVCSEGRYAFRLACYRGWFAGYV